MKILILLAASFLLYFGFWSLGTSLIISGWHGLFHCLGGLLFFCAAIWLFSIYFDSREGK